MPYICFAVTVKKRKSQKSPIANQKKRRYELIKSQHKDTGAKRGKMRTGEVT